MPEGDTVWLTANRLHKALAGRPLTVSDFPVADLIREVLAEVEPLIARTQLAVTTRVDEGLPVLRSDRQKVKQVPIGPESSLP